MHHAAAKCQTQRCAGTGMFPARYVLILRRARSIVHLAVCKHTKQLAHLCFPRVLNSSAAVHSANGVNGEMGRRKVNGSTANGPPGNGRPWGTKLAVQLLLLATCTGACHYWCLMFATMPIRFAITSSLPDISWSRCCMASSSCRISLSCCWIPGPSGREGKLRLWKGQCSHTACKRRR